MKSYWRILGFAKPIGKYMIPYFFYSLLYAIFNLCTFSLIIPIVNSLFNGGEMEAVTQLPAARLDMDYLGELLRYAIYRFYGEQFNLVSVLSLLACVLFAAALMSNLFRYLGQWTAEKMKINTLQKIRNNVYDNVINLNLGYFSNERKGDIISRITSDVQVVQFCITNTLQVLFRDPMLIITYVVGMIIISPQLSLFSVIYLPAVALIIGQIVKRLRNPARQVQEKFGE